MITLDLPIEDYLASKRVSHHKMRTLESCGPRAYWIRHEQHKHTPEDTKAFLAGRAMEDALQRPADFQARYIAKPQGMSFATKEGKAWRTEQQEKGLEVLDGEDARAIEALLSTLESCPMAKVLMGAASAQATIFHDDVRDSWNVPGLQSRPDWLCLDGCAASDWRPYCLDLKTTSKLQQLASGRSILGYGYHRQGGAVRMCLKREGVDLSHFRYLLLGAEKAFPYRWRVFEVPISLLLEGEAWCGAQLDTLSQHYTDGHWPLVTSEIVMADVPRWHEGDSDDDSEAA